MLKHSGLIGLFAVLSLFCNQKAFAVTYATFWDQLFAVYDKTRGDYADLQYAGADKIAQDNGRCDAASKADRESRINQYNYTFSFYTIPNLAPFFFPSDSNDERLIAAVAAIKLIDKQVACQFPKIQYNKQVEYFRQSCPGGGCNNLIKTRYLNSKLMPQVCPTTTTLNWNYDFFGYVNGIAYTEIDLPLYANLTCQVKEQHWGFDQYGLSKKKDYNYSMPPKMASDPYTFYPLAPMQNHIEVGDEYISYELTCGACTTFVQVTSVTQKWQYQTGWLQAIKDYYGSKASFPKGTRPLF